MWLINRATYTLEYHQDPSHIRYLILSHTWGDQEVTFQDMNHLKTAKKKKGFKKIKGICEINLHPDVKHVWVDTCCIDKTSSAELTESINSMFQWYKDASECVVYLEDLEPDKCIATMEQIRPCRWFTRGWTLQELIAPFDISIYDKSWNFRGTKRDTAESLSVITGIDQEVLLHQRELSTIAVARRMSWAAPRRTTRIEDRAYSLLGIFDIHMPLIYGEGQNAFTRLQEMIASRIDDLSLFSWGVGISRPPRQWHSLYAPSLSWFTCLDCGELQHCGKLERIHDPVIPRTNLSVTSTGVEIKAALGIEMDKEYRFMTDGHLVRDPDAPYTHNILILHCGVNAASNDSEDSDRHLVAAIRLKETNQGFVRDRNLGLIDQSLLYFTEPSTIRITKGRWEDTTLNVGSPGLQGYPPTLELSLDASSLALGGEPDGIRFETALYPRERVIHDLEKRHVFHSLGAERFSCFMEIKLINTTGDERQSTTTVWAFSGVADQNKNPAPSNNPADDMAWVALITEDTNLPGLEKYATKDFYNPYNLSNIGHLFRSMYYNNPYCLPTHCRVIVGGGKVPESKMTQIELSAETKYCRVLVKAVETT
ncbi:heterokaryon incompatibility protein-domain-containing protein [Apodospora peruviana]|uniref:Heterokaryon incompatibility protein-domain-containing protein n=1 Tax=Apodospora peruviana TaxID=516989 RepID=A0AAE0M082_9PEZI|nr:heterokaryon incompatibility protein-domain-containing protein [Apodospora peruviana]